MLETEISKLEVLRRRRGLSITMMRRLVFDHGLSAEKLLSPNEADRE